MKISHINMLRGPNYWTNQTAVRALVVCEEIETNINQMDGFKERLSTYLPEINLHTPNDNHSPRRLECSEGSPTSTSIVTSGDPSSQAPRDDVRAVTPNLSIAHVIEQIVFAMQRRVGCPISFSCTRPTLEKGTFQVVVQYIAEEVASLAMKLAEKLCQAVIQNDPFDMTDAIAQLQDCVDDVCFGVSTQAIVDAAVARGIPFHRLTSGSLVQLGWGKHQRRIQAATTDRTSAIAEGIAQDKELTRYLLSAAGVPVSDGCVVNDVESAWDAACDIGLPVVLKPRDGNQGKGVTVNIETREQLVAAFDFATRYGDEVIVETYLLGDSFRLLVVGNKLVAAARCEPPKVIADGQHTIRQLVDKLNKDPRRGAGHGTTLTRVSLDNMSLACLTEQGLTLESIPLKGRPVLLRSNANLSTGGSATDVTEDVHPDVAAIAVRAAKMTGLNICGVDIVCKNIKNPIEEQGGGVVEVNAAPGLRMHMFPSFGTGRPVADAIISELFAEGDNGRIPVIAVTGNNGKTTTVRLISHIMKQSGLCVGMTGSDGVYIDGRRIKSGDCGGPRSARDVLLNPDVEAAVLETARGGLLRAGLAFDRCDIAVVTNIGLGDHLGLGHINTTDELAALKRTIVRNLSPSGVAVLNAADPLVAGMAPENRGMVTFFAQDLHHPVMSAHHQQGHRVIYIDGTDLVAAQGHHQVNIPFADIPMTYNGTIGFQVENVMAAVGAAWGQGLAWDIIKHGLKTFINDMHSGAGRFNLFNYQGATLIADYGHNPDAIYALVKAVDNMPAKRRVVVISGLGDRRDEDLIQMTQVLGDAFDVVLLYQGVYQRGRADGEVLALLRKGLINAKRTTVVEEIHGHLQAIDTALTYLNDGDLGLIFIETVDEGLAHITQRVSSL